ncbi:MAG: hypothetical protein HQ581_15060 [Planctomycetes bacterium]|nr:hypothetical protein [Planctomycetota bacterium]
MNPIRQNPIRRWAVGVTTAPRPRSTLESTLAGLRTAGWPDCRIFDDREGAGAWRNWIGALETLLTQRPDADALMLAQDDAVFCRGLRVYLEKNLWPAADVALCSPYCPSPYRKPSRGWHRQDHGWYLVGAVCWVIPPRAARAIVRDLGGVEARDRIDARVGRWAAKTGRSVWYHTPSFVQHAGNGNSALGDPLVNRLRMAADFVGQQSDANSYSSHLAPRDVACKRLAPPRLHLAERDGYYTRDRKEP